MVSCFGSVSPVKLGKEELPSMPCFVAPLGRGMSPLAIPISIQRESCCIAALVLLHTETSLPREVREGEVGSVMDVL